MDGERCLRRLTALHDSIRGRVRELTLTGTTEALTRPTEMGEGDTAFGIDLHAERILDDFFADWGAEEPVLLVAEGIGGDGGRTYPPGARREDVALTVVVDPIDGTRGLMYGKRSAWILSGVAPPPHGRLPRLDEIELAVQTELPTARSHLSDRLWAARGGGVQAETCNLLTGERTPFTPRPSRAPTLRYGFATVAKFFPDTKVLAATLEERLFAEVLGSGERNPQVFDDEYISSGGQLYELTVGHDRFVADLRPLLGESGLCAHPYDLCTELIAREAGVIVVDPSAGPLRTSLDIRQNVAWVGYANEALRAEIEPVLSRLLGEMGKEMP